ncbi:hypothetical protein EA462_10655 [Natrarchaeobius halalkaliphilus]|uniref:Uncharacterized protein n=1 Tax=Natrarchaeobius halalkaliphilus TaxID=1679091 RepID=A0A3N6MTZ6_9EURY|nr:hypothetical protein EA462_10655 [Natrarchaeobius halalkaliphilus]
MASLAARSSRLTSTRVREVTFLEDLYATQSTAVEMFQVLRLLWMSSMWIGVLPRNPFRLVDDQM